MAKTTKTAPKDEAAEIKRCACGCGRPTTKTWAMGHDQLHKGVLLRAFDAGSIEAREELVERGWRTADELFRRQTAREDKAAAKAARAKKASPTPEPEQPKAKVSRGRRTRRTAEATAAAA